jgi:hypothetical protein
MDQNDFGRLTRQVAAAPSRRAALRLVAAGAAAALVPVLGERRATAQRVTPDSQIVTGCRLVGQRCDGDTNCCSNHCANKRCRCLGKGASCLVDPGHGLPPLPVKANCCTSKCSKHDHKCK